METLEAATEDGTIRLLRTGSGPPVVLVPGQNMSAQRWVETGYVDALQDEYTVLAVDPLGHGDSDKPHDPECYAPERLTAHLLAAIDAADVSTAVIWGYSRGGAMASHAASAHPDRFTGCVVGGYVLVDPTPALELIGVDRIEGLVAQAEALESDDWATYWERFGLPLPEDTKRMMERANDPRAIAALLRAQIDGPQWFECPSRPTLAYWGTEEIFHVLNEPAGAELDLEWATLPGGHAEVYLDVAGSLAIVRPFLEAHARIAG